MKVDEIVKRMLVCNLRRWLEDLNGWLKWTIDAIERSDTVEEVMYWKKRLLTVMLDNLPLSVGHCYFCLKHDMKCDECEYARVHGFCVRRDSDYKRIVDEVKRLREMIDELYYRDESYDQA